MNWARTAVTATFLLALAPAARAAETRVTITGPVSHPLLIELGGGVSDYLSGTGTKTGTVANNEGLEKITDPGAAYGVRAVYHVMPVVGVEAAYEGATNRLFSETGSDSNLMTNGGEVLLRGELPLRLGSGFALAPFLAAGGAYQNRYVYTPSGTKPSTTEFQTSDDFAIPAAVGLQGYIGDRFTASARGTYRYIFNDQVRTAIGQRDAQTWAATAHVGYMF